ncbi:TD and POZ domain-containing protein 5-like [Musca autumnalis]|uniref:TD and POZ domain-containing protein 5-like n=1 Tax=Musca autumnalis TaxID=221902 RepID=UPI003CEAB540
MSLSNPPSHLPQGKIEQFFLNQIYWYLLKGEKTSKTITEKCINNKIEFMRIEGNILAENNLAIKLKITESNIPVERVTITPKRKLKKDIENVATITNDFAKILTSNEYSDITLVARDGSEFKAHKLILSVRSEVFAAMFRNNFAESETNRIEIEDMEGEVLREMLNHIYTDREIPREPRDMAAQLFAAANKYALSNLKKMCETALIKTLDFASVADTLLLAERHSNDELKSKAIQFAVNNIKTVTETTSWKNLRETEPRLCVDVLEKAIKDRIDLF